MMVKQSKFIEPTVNSDNIRLRIGALITAFRSETQIELPEGYVRLDAESGDKLDTVNGEFAWWCTRHEAELVQHALYLEHPISTVVRVWQGVKKGEQPAPFARLSVRAPMSHERIYWPDPKAQSDWQVFRDTGYAPGMAYSDWKSQERAETEEI